MVVIVQLLILITLQMIAVDPKKSKRRMGEKTRTSQMAVACISHCNTHKKLSSACKKFRAKMDREENIVKKVSKGS
jgi:hypothetical protein